MFEWPFLQWYSENVEIVPSRISKFGQILFVGPKLKKIQSHNFCPSQFFFCGTNELLVIARSLLLFKYWIFPF